MEKKLYKSINLFLFVCLAVVFQNFTATEKMTANELLDKYTETQEKLQSSFVIKSEPVTDDPEKKGVCVKQDVMAIMTESTRSCEDITTSGLIRA